MIEWNISDVPEHFSGVASLAFECGFLAALFGSVVKDGRGRDLDIQLRPYDNMTQDAARFAREFGGQLHRRRVDVSTGCESYEVVKGARLFHFVFGTMRKV